MDEPASAHTQKPGPDPAQQQNARGPGCWVPAISRYRTTTARLAATAPVPAAPANYGPFSDLTVLT